MGKGIASHSKPSSLTPWWSRVRRPPLASLLVADWDLHLARVGVAGAQVVTLHDVD